MTIKLTYEELEQRVKELEKFEAKHKRAEKDVLDAKQKWTSLIENTNDFIMIIDDNGKIQYINRVIPPHTVNQVIGKTLYDFSAPQHHEMIRQAVARVFETRKEGSYTSSVKHPTGVQWFETTMVPMIKEEKVRSAISFNKNITEIKQAEETLRKAHDKLEHRVNKRSAELTEINKQLKQEIEERKRIEEKLQALLNATTETAMLTDLDAKILAVNEVAAKRFGKSSKELIGLGIFDYLPHDMAKSRKVKGDEAVHTGKPVRFQDERDGKYYDNNIYPVFDAKGKTKALAIYAKDITETKQTKSALRESEERYKELTELLPISIYEVDNSGKITFANRSAFDQFGYTQDEFDQGLIAFDLLAPEDRKRGMENIQRILNGEQLGIQEYIALRKDGSTFTGLTNSTTITHAEKNIGLRGFLIDITKLKQTEEALRESEERYRNLVEEQSELICRYTPDWKLTFANEAYCKYFGKRHEKLIGSSFMMLLPLEDQKKVAKNHHALLSSSLKEMVHEHQVIDGKGEIRWQQWVNRVLYDRNGLLKECQSVGRDITDLKKTETELKTSIKEKELLLQEVHHRVKNNFEIVSSLIEMSSMHKENQEVQNLCKNARARIHSMALIHTQLYQANRLDQVDMEGHIQELADHLSQVYKGNGGRITTMIEPSEVYLSVNQAIPCALVLNELITNAFKHAFQKQEKGTIYISINNSVGNTIQISVKDDGRGIPDGVDLSNATGLGLTLAKQLIVGQLKGEMRFNIDNGTEFQIEFKKVG
ncbi:PAS domain S-box protein [Thermodesulfobacteriota bacterium]